MGLSGSKQTTTSTYTPSAQQVQAGNTLNQTFGQQLPKIQGYADQIGGLLPSMLDKYRAGDAGVNAARNWITETLGQQGGNPFLDQMIGQAGTDTANTINASIGTRGLTGGSVQQKILARELAKQSLGMRYEDFNRQQGLKATAAGMAPSIAAGDAIQVMPMLSVAGYAGGAPLDATSQYAAGMGGLFGNAGGRGLRFVTRGWGVSSEP
jgi:hypothetical protein